MYKGTTFTRFLIAEQRKFPGATGEFTSLLTELATAAKIIAHEVNRAGLGNILGAAGRTNVQGEQVQKLDEFANETIIRMVDHTGHLAGMVSEEMEDIFHIQEHHLRGKYLLLFDPLDGSSNIDVSVGVGTIFGIHRKITPGEDATPEDFLQKGRAQLCAGYLLYGSSTMLVYTAGQGVHGFTLDPNVGEFLLSHEQMTIMKRGKTFSVNDGRYFLWDHPIRHYIDDLRGKEGGSPYSSRYIGSLVADFHRNLLKGGIYLYPGDRESPSGKLRLLYEANPLAFIVEQAGGRASSGTEAILDIQPITLHQRTPLFIGSEEDVRMVEAYIKEGGKR
ncbi:MAG: class 1 fructose-bisphosphatase [Candidatus Latescibacteria bacterium]|nr:class 1 fructose-bisphosphatase [Candidatus Latescibacterota bacterium]